VVETRLVRRDVPLDRSPRRGQQIATLLVGLGLLVVGAQGLGTGAVEIATLLGLPALVVGLTIVAIGTSLPELATSVAASARGERDIAIGSIVGSSLFNLGAVLGITTLISATGSPSPRAPSPSTSRSWSRLPWPASRSSSPAT
jgi:cation:H+ antiporter